MTNTEITREKAHESSICNALAERGWTYEEGRNDQGWDRRLALYPADVLQWLSTQYPEEYAKAVPCGLPGSNTRGRAAQTPRTRR
ncbi:hypothetical protein QQA05_02555 [Corynebacterium macclintockiae]|uniref:hypothetical protein n=1 Tax=Corynebacterium macclintockiae TaxID=2913501 RepID=UPI00255166A2|nr:hypothetical protein [Corynebacterium macclintockiae]MDK8890287.1 hypothetical protein [Corynebacterium macclintockiae]